VARELRAGNVPGNGLMTPLAASPSAGRGDGPAAFYKYAKPANFLITSGQAWAVTQ